jgi:hypothetical protein
LPASAVQAARAHTDIVGTTFMIVSPAAPKVSGKKDSTVYAGDEASRFY